MTTGGGSREDERAIGNSGSHAVSTVRLRREGKVTRCVRSASTCPYKMIIVKMPRLLLATACLVFVAAAAESRPATIHTIFSTECNRYFDWCDFFSHSHRKSKACTAINSFQITQ